MEDNKDEAPDCAGNKLAEIKVASAILVVGILAFPAFFLISSCITYLASESAVVRKMKVDAAISTATDRINSLYESNGQFNSIMAGEAKDAVLKARKLLEKYAELDSAITFEILRSDYERTHAASLRKTDSIRREFRPLVPKIMSFLGDEAVKIGSEDERFKQQGGRGESLEELGDRLYKANGGLNQELVSIVAWIRDTTPQRIIDELTGLTRT